MPDVVTGISLHLTKLNMITKSCAKDVNGALDVRLRPSGRTGLHAHHSYAEVDRFMCLHSRLSDGHRALTFNHCL